MLRAEKQPYTTFAISGHLCYSTAMSKRMKRKALRRALKDQQCYLFGRRSIRAFVVKHGEILVHTQYCYPLSYQAKGYERHILWYARSSVIIPSLRISLLSRHPF